MSTPEQKATEYAAVQIVPFVGTHWRTIAAKGFLNGFHSRDAECERLRNLVARMECNCFRDYKTQKVIMKCLRCQALSKEVNHDQQFSQ